MPNSSRWLKQKNVLAEQVARMKSDTLKTYWLQECGLNGESIAKNVGYIRMVTITISG